MLEAYVIITLGALGYLLNSMNNNIKTSKNQINKKETPSMNNIYDSTYFATADNIEKNRAAKVYEESKNPEKTGVISKNQYFDKVKSLTGDYIAKDEFRHNNMTPYFGSHVRQNMKEDTNRMVLENFTGVGDLQKNKCEVASFYDQNKDNIYGSQNQTDYYKERIVAPTSRKNEFPLPQIHVGPGLNKGYSSEGSGGFQQLDAQDYAQEKNVDELRVASKPKVTFEGRVLPGGLKSGLPGKTGAFAKNKVETFFEQTPDMYLKTTASVLKQSQIPNFNVKQTNRVETTKEYQGSAFNNRARQADPSVQPTARQQLQDTGIRNAIMSVLGMGEKNDHGKSNIIVYNNERDLTTTRTYQGNVQSLIKAIIAPIEDMIKVTKKQEFVDNSREYGQLAPQMPSKSTMYDPNDVARTTLKETTIHDAILGNLKGSEKLTVHDPNDVTRTTLKETTLHDAILGNLKGSEKLTVHDPNDVTRTTLKETTIHDAILGNLRGSQKLTVNDPNDVARTTLKETNLHDSIMGNLKGSEKLTIYDPNDVARTTIKETLLSEADNTNLTGPKVLYVYDPDEIAKRTIRETLDRNDYELNMASIVKKMTMYDPDDLAKTTMKETLIDGQRYGNTDRYNRGGGYETNEMDAKNTQKQFLSDYEHFGGGTRDKGQGYSTNEMDAKTTQKQFLSDYEYYGHAESSTEKKMMSYEDIENAHIRENKEVTLFGREPQGSGVKSFNNSVSMHVKKPECDIRAEREFHTSDRVYNEISSMEDKTITKNRMSVDLDIGDRLDVDLLNALKDNPYAHKMGDIAGY